MDLSLQAKLLRVLQEREVERLGSRKTIKLDVRVLATSNRDLCEAVNDGIFREDLYYRLNVFPIEWLPLAKRPGDIVPLAEHLIKRHNNDTPVIFEQAAKEKLLSYNWPGNVRELENVMQRALILQSGTHISADDIFLGSASGLQQETHVAPPTQQSIVIEDQAEVPDISVLNQVSELHDTPSDYKQELKDKENSIILDMLRACNGKRKDVADKLGMSPRTLRYKLAKMREMGIELPA